MKRFTAFLVGLFLCNLFSLALPRPAEARSFVNVLALAPDTIMHVVTVGTDTAEYVTGKIAQGFAKVDTVADAGVDFFHNLAHPTAAATAAKAQAKAAKKAAKAQKKASNTQPVSCAHVQCSDNATLVPISQ